MKKFNFIRSKFEQGGLPIDPLLQSSIDWYKQWYEQRKKLPQFKFTAESRLGILDRSPNVILKPFEELNKYDAVAMYQNIPRQRGDVTSRDIIYAADPASVPGFQEAYEKRKGIKLGERISTDLGTNPNVMMHELSHWFDSREPQTMWKPREAKGEPEYEKYPKFRGGFKNSGLDKDQYRWIGSNQRLVGNSTLKTEFNAVLNELRQQEGLKGDQPTTPEQMGIIIQKYMNLPANKLQKTNPEGTRNQRIQTLIQYLQQDPARLSELNNTIVKKYNPQNSIFIGKVGGLPKYQQRPGTVGENPIIKLITTDNKTYELTPKDPLYHWFYGDAATNPSKSYIKTKNPDGSWNLSVSSADIPAEFNQPYYSKITRSPEVVVNYVPETKRAASTRENPNTPFIFPDGTEKLWKDMDWKEQAYVSGKNMGSWESGNWTDWINPVAMIGAMGEGVGTAPYLSEKTGSVLPYVFGAISPMLTGALGGLGTKTVGQFAENVLSPIPTNIVNNTARLANQGRQYLGNTYRNVAEGDNIFNYAWRSPAAGITDDVATRMYQQTRNDVPLDVSAKDIISEYQHTSGPFTGRFESGNVNLAKRFDLENAIAERNLVTQSGKPNVLIRRFDPNNSELYSLDASGQFILNRPTSWSVGRGWDYNSKPNRIVFKMPSGSRGMLNEYNASKFDQDVSKLMVEREAILGSGLNLGKRLGKVKNEFGGYDYIHRFEGYKPTEWDDIRRLNTENIGEIVNLNNNLATSGNFNLGVYPFLKNPNILLKLGRVSQNELLGINNQKIYTGIPSLLRNMPTEAWSKISIPFHEINMSGLTSKTLNRPVIENSKILGSVMQRAEGKPLSEYSLSELENIQPWDYQDFANSVKHLANKGVGVDFYGDNFFLNKTPYGTNKFTIFDIGPLPNTTKGVFPVGPLYGLNSKAFDQGINQIDPAMIKSILKQKMKSAAYDISKKAGEGAYSNEEISNALQRIYDRIQRADIKYKKGGPIVNSRGFMDGMPPADSNWRIPGNTLYNPTPYKIRAVGSNGVEKTLNPFDTKRVSFGNAKYVDEYKMQNGGSLPTYQGSEGPGIIPVFESEKDRRRYQNELRRIGQDITRLQKKDRRKSGEGNDFEFYFALNTGPRTFSKEYSKRFYANNPYNSSNCINGVCGIELASGLKFSNPTDGDRYLGNPKFLENVQAGKEDFYIYEGDNIEPGDHIIYLNPWGTPYHSKIVYDKNRKGDKINILDNSGGPIFKAINDYDTKDIINNRNQGQILVMRPGRILDKKDESLRLPENKWAFTPKSEEDLLSIYENYHGVQQEKKRSLPYKYSLDPEGPLAQTGNEDLKGVQEFLQFVNDEQNINNLIDQLYKLGRPELANKDMIHRSLLNVFGILGQENKWQDRIFGGSRLGLENTIEHIFNPGSMSIGPGQIKFNTIGKEFKNAFGIKKPKDLRDWKKIIPLMTAIDLTNQQEMLSWGKNFSERIIGEPGLAADEMKWDLATMSPYFYQGRGYKNIKKGLNEEFYNTVYGDLGDYWSWKNPGKILQKSKDRLSTTINYGEWNPNSFSFGLSQEGFNKAAQEHYSNNIRNRQKVFDEGSYGRNVWENWANNIIRYATTGNQENIPSTSQEAIIFPGATTEGERRQALLKYYENLYGPVKSFLNKKYGGSLPNMQDGLPIPGGIGMSLIPKMISLASSILGGKNKEKVSVPAVAKPTTPVSNTIYINDPRKVRLTTGVAIDPKRDLMSGSYDKNIMIDIIKKAKKRNIDPYVGLAIGMQESGLGKIDGNIGHTLDSNRKVDPVSRYLDIYLQKQKEADRLGITDPYSRIQLYNGWGKIFPGTEQKYHGFKMKKIYGVPVPAGGLDLRKNPLYGKQIIDIMDNILKKNPEIIKLVEEVKKNGGLTANKAREILHHGEIGGRKLSDKQRKFFGAMSRGNTKKY